jgi:hypothetical protein
MSPVEFEPAITESEGPQTYALDRDRHIVIYVIVWHILLVSLLLLTEILSEAPFISNGFGRLLIIIITIIQMIINNDSGRFRKENARRKENTIDPISVMFLIYFWPCK